jgi:competence protein ComEC
VPIESPSELARHVDGRPTVRACLALALPFVAGIALATVFEAPPWGPLVALAAALALAARIWNAQVAMVLGAFGALAAGLASAPASRDLDCPGLPQGLLRLEGEVVDVRHTPEARAVLRVEAIEAVEAATPPDLLGHRVELRGLDRARGTRLMALVRLAPVVPFRNPSPHPALPDPRRPLARGQVRGAVRVLDAPPPLEALRHGVASRLRGHLLSSLSPRAASLARALLLGDRRTLTDADQDAVRGAGLSHVLAVSGLHVTLLAGSLLLLLRWALLRTPLARRLDVTVPAVLAASGVALAYAALVGSAPSAWRAALTATIGWTARAAGRRAAPGRLVLAALMAAAALMPDQVLRPGFSLSVLATAGLVSGGGRGSLLRRGVEASLRTLVATAPVLLWVFGGLPLVGVLANLAGVPVATLVVLPVTVLHGLLVLVHPALGGLTSGLVDLAAAALLGLSAAFPAGVTALPPPDLVQGLIVTAASVGLLAASRWRTRAAVAVSAALALLAAEAHLRHREQPRDRLRVTFLDVGQGDAALVDLPDGRLLVVDAGGNPSGGRDPGRAVLRPLLAARRRTRVDVFALSHPHPDHYGGLAALLDGVEDGALRLGTIWDTGQAWLEDPEGEAGQLLARARRLGVAVVGPRHLCGRPWRFGAATVRVEAPCPEVDVGYGPNENSLRLRLTFHRRTVLFAGDSERVAEARWLAAEPAPVDVLKVAHHGSRTSSLEPLLRRLEPRVAVVSAGRGNPFGHPHPEVWERLERLTGRALRTDRHGGVVVETDGDDLSVRPSRLSRR